MASLPFELVVEILSRLPVKSLLRFTSVCKSWKSLIRNPNFIKLHLNKTLTSNTPDRHLICCHGSIRIAEINTNSNQFHFSKLYEHPFEPDELDLFVIVGFCNGIVCFNVSEEVEFYLYNPLTNSHRKLPIYPDADTEYMNVWFGFGYDSGSDDYKVLLWLQWDEDDDDDDDYGGRIFQDEAHVYSLRNNSWKSIQFQTLGRAYFLLPGVGAPVNEVLHFVAVKYVDDDLNIESCYIVKFDLRTETFALMDIPQGARIRKNDTVVLSELGGSLCLYIGDDIYGEFWLMKEELWKMLFIHDLSSGSGLCGTEIKCLAYSDDEKRVLLGISSTKLCWYDLKREVINNFDETEIMELFDGWERPEIDEGLGIPTLDGGVFTGSLVLLDDVEP